MHELAFKSLIIFTRAVHRSFFFEYHSWGGQEYAYPSTGIKQKAFHDKVSGRVPLAYRE